MTNERQFFEHIQWHAKESKRWPGLWITRTGQHVWREVNVYAFTFYIRLQISPNRDGYPALKDAGYESENGRPIRYLAIHSLVMDAHGPPQPPNARLVRHIDGNKSNSHIENLRWGTDRDNYEDALRHGTYVPLNAQRDWLDLTRRLSERERAAVNWFAWQKIKFRERTKRQKE